MASAQLNTVVAAPNVPRGLFIPFIGLFTRRRNGTKDQDRRAFALACTVSISLN